jgi:hypothetical protein
MRQRFRARVQTGGATNESSSIMQSLQRAPSCAGSQERRPDVCGARLASL